MSSWRLKWAVREVLTPANYSKHSRALQSPLKYWLALLVKLIPGLWKAPIRLTLRNGHMIDVREFMTLYIYKEIFVQGCYDAPTLPKNPNIIDVGANTGLFAMRAKQRYPRATVHCYEPMPGNFRQLSENFGLNGLDCAAFQEGVGATGRAEKLFIHKRNIGGHSINPVVASSSTSIEIALTGIREAIKRLPGGICHLLKLDCEGAEHEILMAIDSELAPRIERLVFEPTPSLYSIDVLKAHLGRHGYLVEWNDGVFVGVHARLCDEQPHRATSAHC